MHDLIPAPKVDLPASRITRRSARSRPGCWRSTTSGSSEQAASCFRRPGADIEKRLEPGTSTSRSARRIRQQLCRHASRKGSPDVLRSASHLDGKGQKHVRSAPWNLPTGGSRHGRQLAQLRFFGSRCAVAFLDLANGRIPVKVISTLDRGRFCNQASARKQLASNSSGNSESL